jgi:putative Ca2+/H+ antiporter (TMEM165/GDT1 family)
MGRVGFWVMLGVLAGVVVGDALMGRWVLHVEPLAFVAFAIWALTSKPGSANRGEPPDPPGG